MDQLTNDLIYGKILVEKQQLNEVVTPLFHIHLHNTADIIKSACVEFNKAIEDVKYNGWGDESRTKSELKNIKMELAKLEDIMHDFKNLLL